MIVQKELRRLLKELSDRETAELTLSFSPIRIRVMDNGSKLALAISVYEGGNYIPKSVRQGLNAKPPFRPNSIRTFLKVDEDQYQVYLNYLGPLGHLNDHQLQEILEEFNEMADEWRLYLDEHDKNDLIYIHVKN